MRRLVRWGTRVVGAVVAVAAFGTGDLALAQIQTCGDVDGNGTVDVIDAANVSRAAVGLPSSCTGAPNLCDVDGSGTIDVIDAANVSRAAVGLPAANNCPGAAPEPTPTPGGAIQVVDFGTVPLQAFVPSQSFEVDVPPGTSSLTLIADAGVAPRVFVNSLTSPAGPLPVDPFAVPPALRIDVNGGVGVVTVPNTPLIPLLAGRYRFTLGSFTSVNARLSALLNRRSGLASGRLNLRIFFVAIPGVTAVTAPANPTVAAVLNRYNQILGPVGITLGTVTFEDFPEPQASQLTLIDDVDANNNQQPDDVDQLFSLPRAVLANTVDLFVVQGFLNSTTIGFAGNIPGPAIVGPTVNSGVVVAALGDVASLAWTAVHETGHYLGLYHTTENGLVTVDPLLDTPECPAFIFLTNQTMCPDAPNVMFPTLLVPLVNQSVLTTDQRYVLQRSPLVGD